MPPKRRQPTADASLPDPKRRQTRSATKALAVAKEDQEPKQETSKLQSKDPDDPVKRRQKQAIPKTSGSQNTAKPKPGRTVAKRVEDRPKVASDAKSDASSTVLTLTDPSLKSPIHCELHQPPNPLPDTANPSYTLIYTHGAGGTLSTPTIQTFKAGYSRTSSILLFQGSPNLASRVKAFHACVAHIKSQEQALWSTDGQNGWQTKVLTLGGRSMGARAAVQVALSGKAPCGKAPPPPVDLVLVSYPLQTTAGSKVAASKQGKEQGTDQNKDDPRTQVLLDLSGHDAVLFIVGSRDPMCPLEALNSVRAKMKARSWVVVMEGLDHGMRGKGEEELGEMAGRLAAEWVQVRERRECEEGSRWSLDDVRVFKAGDGDRKNKESSG